MSRIKQTLATLREQGRKALIPYLVAGDPGAEETVALMHQLVADGADIIELGIPFSDPSSDGPVIQLGAERALRKGTGLRDVMNMVAEFRKQDAETPIVLMGYLNPLEALGYETVVNRAKEVGVDGFLIVDMPVSEANELLPLCRDKAIDVIFLVAPTTTDQRLSGICDHSSGYIYYVSLKGVTGAAISDHGDIENRVASLRDKTELPVVVGFGIKDADSARAMAAISDGVIVGSALVDRIAALSANNDGSESDQTRPSYAECTALIADIRGGLDQTAR